jgi:uncharacterized protein YfdQ (DUF2303 family)
MPETPDAQVIVDTATRAAAATIVEPGKTYAFVTPEGTVETVDRDLDIFRDRPRRKTGTVSVHDAASFVAYVKKHGLPETEVYADIPNAKLVAVINAHTASEAGWGDHRLQLTLRKTPAWQAWAASDGRLLRQADFAEHVEDRVPDFVTPDGATMLELAQSFQAANKVDFESSEMLSTGQVKFTYRETVEAKAGRKGAIEIPRTFEIAVEVFEGSGVRDKFTARLRYRIADSGLAIGYKLERPEDVLRTAFLDQVNAVEERIDQTVLRGAAA